ncbi:GDSL-type esterase/lipase family protein [Microbacterium sp. R86528]|uniref:GDSL-type esterase/lipase family protein n=1 Tax=Microbacterium sp. R86528 TaxID=3093864 RepID=UPI0037CC70A7
MSVSRESKRELINVPLRDGPVTVRGAVWIEETAQGVVPRRFLQPASERIVDDFMRAAMVQSTGVRLAFRTAATRVQLRVFATKLADSVDAPLAPALYDICADGEVVSVASSLDGARVVLANRALDQTIAGDEVSLAFALDGVERDYELWLPYSDEVELREFSADAPVVAVADDRTRPRWVHHGSSISHGYVASRTTKTWPAQVAQACALDLVNLSYTGNAVLDQSTARTIRDTPADVITVKLGINIVNGDSMRLWVFRSAVHGFLDTIREGQPDTPILVISPICCPPVESVPGPTLRQGAGESSWTVTSGQAREVAEGKLSLEVIRRELKEIVAARAATDPHLAYLDGLQLYGVADNARLPMPDNLHPADDVNTLIAERFVSAAFGEDGWMPAVELQTRMD